MPHKLGKKIGPGKWNVIHPDGCECQMIYSVNHARWVTYNGITGEATCNHCGTTLDLPMPAVRENWLTKRVFMSLKAIEDDLWAWQQRHENCPPPAAPPQSSTPD